MESFGEFTSKTKINNIVIEPKGNGLYSWFVDTVAHDWYGTIHIYNNEIADIDWGTSGILPEYWKELETKITEETYKFIVNKPN